MAEAIDGNWAVVLTAAGKYVGRVTAQKPPHVTMEQVFEVVYEGDGGRLKRYLRPFLLQSHETPLALTVVGIAPFADMHIDDQADWFDMIRAVQKGMEQMRAQKAGLLLPRGSS